MFIVLEYTKVIGSSHLTMDREISEAEDQICAKTARGAASPLGSPMDATFQACNQARSFRLDQRDTSERLYWPIELVSAGGMAERGLNLRLSGYEPAAVASLIALRTSDHSTGYLKPAFMERPASVAGGGGCIR